MVTYYARAVVYITESPSENKRRLVSKKMVNNPRGEIAVEE